MPKKSNCFCEAQSRVKRSRPVYYSGPKKNCDPERARHIIEMYLVGQMGYTPIRYIIGDENEHRIENVIRQHMLGRKKSP